MVSPCVDGLHPVRHRHAIDGNGAHLPTQAKQGSDWWEPGQGRTGHARFEAPASSSGEERAQAARVGHCPACEAYRAGVDIVVSGKRPAASWCKDIGPAMIAVGSRQSITAQGRFDLPRHRNRAGLLDTHRAEVESRPVTAERRDDPAHRRIVDHLGRVRRRHHGVAAAHAARRRGRGALIWSFTSAGWMGCGWGKAGMRSTLNPVVLFQGLPARGTAVRRGNHTRRTAHFPQDFTARTRRAGPGVGQYEATARIHSAARAVSGKARTTTQPNRKIRAIPGSRYGADRLGSAKTTDKTTAATIDADIAGLSNITRRFPRSRLPNLHPLHASDPVRA